MKLIDTHCHLQDQKLSNDLDSILTNAKASGVEKFVCCGTCEDDWEKVISVSKKFESVLPSLGLHPWFIKGRSINWIEKLEELISKTNCAIGEIGLDTKINDNNIKEEEEVFILQLKLAIKLNRPASIHCRKAFDRLYAIFKKHGAPACGFLIHSYSGPPELILNLASLGGYFSFSGAITYSGNKRAHKSAQLTPLDRLLAETDSPDMMPVIAGKAPDKNTNINTPQNLLHVINKLASLKKISQNELAEITYNNALKLFF